MIAEAGSLVVVFAAAAVAAKSFYKLDPGQSAVRMFLGKVRGYDNRPGPHLKAPWESIKRLETKQKYEEINLTNVKTEDGYFVGLPVKLQYKIVEPDKFLFGADEPRKQMISMLENAIRSQVAKMEFDSLYASKDAFMHTIEDHEKANILSTFGIELVGVVLGDPQPDAAVMAAKNERIREIEVAKGHKNAQILEGEGIAGKQAAIFAGYKARLQMLEGMDPANAEALLIQSVGFDFMTHAAGHGNMIVASSDPSAVLAQHAAILAGMNKRQQNPVTAPATEQYGGLAAPKV